MLLFFPTLSASFTASSILYCVSHRVAFIVVSYSLYCTGISVSSFSLYIVSNFPFASSADKPDTSIPSIFTPLTIVSLFMFANANIVENISTNKNIINSVIVIGIHFLFFLLSVIFFFSFSIFFEFSCTCLNSSVSFSSLSFNFSFSIILSPYLFS